MVYKVKYILTVCVIIIFILFLLFYIRNNKPANVIKSKINLQLPSDSKIIHFSSVKFEGRLDAKIHINERDIENIKKDLLGFFRGEYELEDDEYILNRYTVPWWSIKKEDVQICYFRASDGEKFLFFPSAKTKLIYAIITKEDDKYYLYITW